MTGSGDGTEAGAVVFDEPFDASTLHELRERIAACPDVAGVPEDRAADVLLAVHELAANAIKHGGGAGKVLMRAAPGVLVCQVSDDGPDAGPWPVRQGHGLWIVRAVADEVRASSGQYGSQVTAIFRYPGPGLTTPADRKGDMMTGVTELSVSVSLEHRDDAARTVVRLAGEADVSTLALAEILSAEAAKKPRLLLVDISGLAFIDSAALHEMVQVHRQLRAGGGLLALVGPTDQVARILQLSGIDQVISVHASAEEADTP